MAPTKSAVSEKTAGVTSLVEFSRVAAARYERDDLVQRLEHTQERLARPDTVVAVIGEFKHGKSSLINGLLGRDICPVDDDLATAVITLLRFAPTPVGRLRLQGEDPDEVRSFDPADLAQLVTERVAVDGEAPVALVELGLPNPFLRRGLALVDTPGVGGLDPATMTMTLSYLERADALLFATDAAGPLTLTQIEFLKRAQEATPATMVVLTKIDLHAEWRRIETTVREQIRDAGLDLDVFPISSVLRRAAFTRTDEGLNGESGYPPLLDALKAKVLEPAAEVASARALDDARSSVEQLRAAAGVELSAILTPESLQAQLDELNASKARIEALRGGSARWATVLNDRFADLVSDADHELRTRIRDATRYAETEFEDGDPGKTWDAVTGEVRERVAQGAQEAVRRLEDGADRIGDEIVELLQSEDVALDRISGTAATPDVGGLWSQKPIEQPGIGTRAGTGFAGLRGAQGGVLMMGMVASLSGIAIATVALAGAGIVFGGKQILDERKRQLTQRRQQARTSVRQFLDDVQFEVTKTTRDLSRQLQRQLRDHFSERIAELTRTYAQAADGLQKALTQGEAERTARRRELEGITSDLDKLARSIEAAR